MEVHETATDERLTPASVARLRAHLEALYPAHDAASAQTGLVHLLEKHLAAHPPRRKPEALFDERSVVLITYGDQVREPGVPPLATLTDFLSSHLGDVLDTVHVLPFYPWTSDDGFAVTDYLAVDPALGSWEDVERLAERFHLMVDGVFNHLSASSHWFRRWSDGDPALARFFVTADPGEELSGVVRPRTTPLLSPVATVEGTRHVWTTFGPDQVDLNYANPQVLLAVTDVLLRYLAHGARLIRLDAVAFLWKDPATPCVHLPQTHELVKLWRTIVDIVAPGTLLITETNVPHAENVSYFGDGDDEAHLVYQFPLAPLVLAAFHLADARVLSEWLTDLAPPSPQTAFLNFLGSHDGIGLRPAEGLLSPAEIEHLCQLSRAHGGGVSYRVAPDGSLAPYELNSVFFDALTPAGSPEPRQVQVDRFLAAQALLLALAGVPAVYVHALLGSRNWHAGVEQSGRLRTINREKLDRATLEAELASPTSLRHEVFRRFVRLLRVRVAEPAFHPNGAQRLLPAPPAVLAFTRTPPHGGTDVACLHNCSCLSQQVRLKPSGGLWTDLLTGVPVRATGDGIVTLAPYQVLWLKRR